MQCEEVQAFLYVTENTRVIKPVLWELLCSALSNQVSFFSHLNAPCSHKQQPRARCTPVADCSLRARTCIFFLCVSFCSCGQVLLWVNVRLHLQNAFKSSCCWWGVINPEQSLLWVCSLHPWKSCPKSEASSHIRHRKASRWSIGH